MSDRKWRMLVFIFSSFFVIIVLAIMTGLLYLVYLMLSVILSGLGYSVKKIVSLYEIVSFDLLSFYSKYTEIYFGGDWQADTFIVNVPYILVAATIMLVLIILFVLIKTTFNIFLDVIKKNLSIQKDIVLEILLTDRDKWWKEFEIIDMGKGKASKFYLTLVLLFLEDKK